MMKMWSEILKKRDAEHIEPTHYPNRTVTIQANRRHFRATCTQLLIFCQLLTANLYKLTEKEEQPKVFS